MGESTSTVLVRYRLSTGTSSTVPKPERGYMSITVDMKEFSKTFAPEIRFCALCEHGLCPGSELVVFLQCRDCGHIVCEVCKAKEDRLGED